MWNLQKIQNLCTDKEKILEFLREKKLIQREMFCPKCGRKMNIFRLNWLCYKTLKTTKGKTKCYKKISLRKNTLFSKTKLGFEKVLKLTYLIIHNTNSKSIAKELSLSKRTIVQIKTNRSAYNLSDSVSQWNIFIKQILTQWASRGSEILGGPNKVIDIDDLKYGNRKHNKWRILKGQRVLTGVERDTNKFFLVPIDKNDFETLAKIIKKWILPGSTIVFNGKSGYNLKERELKYLTLNHSVNFEYHEPVSQSNGMESWLKKMNDFVPLKERRMDRFLGYLSHFIFIKNSKTEKKDLFDLIINEIANINFDGKWII